LEYFLFFGCVGVAASWTGVLTVAVTVGLVAGAASGVGVGAAGLATGVGALATGAGAFATGAGVGFGVAFTTGFGAGFGAALATGLGVGFGFVIVAVAVGLFLLFLWLAIRPVAAAIGTTAGAHIIST